MFRFACAALLLSLSASCYQATAVKPLATQAEVYRAWHVSQHAVWEIEWSAMPVSGAVVAELWRDGARLRIEILEATAPQLVGATLISDGRNHWYMHRFEKTPPQAQNIPTLSPVTDLTQRIDQQLRRPAGQATQKPDFLLFGSTKHYALDFAPLAQLEIWISLLDDLPRKIRWEQNGQVALITVRSVEPLDQPDERLFVP